MSNLYELPRSTRATPPTPTYVLERMGGVMTPDIERFIPGYHYDPVRNDVAEVADFAALTPSTM